MDAPLSGSISAAAALADGHGRKIALWGGPQRGWLTAHPPKLWGGGGVTSRTERYADWERWTLEVVVHDGARRVALRSAHDRYLSASPGGALTADKAVRDGWELFEFVDRGANRVGLRPVAHAPPRFVSARDATASADARAIGDAETFVLFDDSAATVLYLGANPASKPAPPVAVALAPPPTAVESAPAAAETSAPRAVVLPRAQPTLAAAGKEGYKFGDITRSVVAQATLVGRRDFGSPSAEVARAHELMMDDDDDDFLGYGASKERKDRGAATRAGDSARTPGAADRVDLGDVL